MDVIHAFISTNLWHYNMLQKEAVYPMAQQSGTSPKIVALFLLQTLVAIYYDFFKCMIQSKWNQIMHEFISQTEKNVWFFDFSLLTCSVRKMILICLMQNIDMRLLYKSHQIARLVSHLINHFPNESLPCNTKMLLIFYIIKWVLVAILWWIHA